MVACPRSHHNLIYGIARVHIGGVGMVRGDLEGKVRAVKYEDTLSNGNEVPIHLSLRKHSPYKNQQRIQNLSGNLSTLI
ncbi:hypothetical protein NPIL_142651 [Nephila pilipes]|uniref:Uncharacterized protein n=1 Tax=Nephila pilipes TaxID=299642 RepID=A0A8X6U5E3_NEPPI|nr:hypothetical protein NPIL_142651 [Nephila pilipes]